MRTSLTCLPVLAALLAQALPSRGDSTPAASPPTASPPTVPSFSVAPLTPVPAGEDVIVSVKKGEPAPFTGQLFDLPTALRWGNYLEQARTRLRLDNELYARVTIAQKTYYEGVLGAERDKFKVVTTDLSRRLAAAEWDRDHPPWWKSGWFTFTLGVVVTGGAIGLGAYLAR